MEIDYEKEYEAMVQRARELHETGNELTKRQMEIVCPELRESEDERIRKWLVVYFGSIKEEVWIHRDITCEQILGWLEKQKESLHIQKTCKDNADFFTREQKEQKPIIQDVELNDAVYDYVRDHFIAGADFTPEYIKKLMENAFFAGVDYYLLNQGPESCEPDTNVEKVIEDVIRVYGKTQGEWVGGYDVDTIIVNLRRAFNEKEQKPVECLKAERDGWYVCIKDFYAGGKKQCSVGDLVQAKGGMYMMGRDDISEWFRRAYFEEVRDAFEPNADTNIPEQPAEWSEEDEAFLKVAIAICNRYSHKDVADWLKSRRPQPHWKPSEEQMGALKRIFYNRPIGSAELSEIESLYEQLKKMI